jgi:hypothetical protein
MKENLSMAMIEVISSAYRVRGVDEPSLFFPFLAFEKVTKVWLARRQNM